MSALIFANLVLSSLTLLMVLLVRRPVARLFGAGWAYALWLLPALRLVVPPLPSFGSDLLPPMATVISLAGDSAASVPPEGGSGQWMPLLLVVWAAGAAVFLLWQWLCYRRFLTRLSLSSTSIGAHRGLPLIQSLAVDGPIALGLLDRRIVVPREFDSRYSAAERRLALDHEWIHHRRGDIWWNLAAMLFLASNWFNPLAWIAFRMFRTDQELACDAAVAARATPEERCAYAHALVKSASRPGLIAACPLNSADQLKRRLKMMKTHRKSRLRTAGGIAALSMMLVVSAGLGTAAAQERREGNAKQSERIVIMERHGDGDRSGRPPREFAIRRGPNGEVQLPEGCSHGNAVANVDERTGEQRTRILLCGDGQQNAESRLQSLQRARERMAQSEHLTGEHRQRVLDALDRAIAQARGR